MTTGYNIREGSEELARRAGEDFDAMIRLPDGRLLLVEHKLAHELPLQDMTVAQLARLALRLLDGPLHPASLRV